MSDRFVEWAGSHIPVAGTFVTTVPRRLARLSEEHVLTWFRFWLAARRIPRRTIRRIARHARCCDRIRAVSIDPMLGHRRSE